MKKYFPWFLIILLFLFFFGVSLSIPQESIRAFIEQFGSFAPAVFILISLISFVFAPLSGTPAIFAGHVMFGQTVVIYTTIAALISYGINFWIARKWGRPWVSKLVGSSDMHKIDNFVKSHGPSSLLASRIFLGYFHDLISYAAGLSPMKFKTYVIISALGVIPGTTLWYYLSGLTNNSLAFTGLSWLIGFIFFATYLLVKKFLSRCIVP